jgi:predicted phage tail component-like protein
MKYFTFKSSTGTFNSKSFGILINKIERPLLPPISTQSLVVGKRAGAYLMASVLDPLIITVDITLMNSQTDQELREDIREIAGVLFTDNGKGELIFSDEPNLYYKAQLTADSDLENLASMGEGTLQFIMGEPYAFSTTEKTATISTSATVQNNGTLPTYPYFRLTTGVEVYDLNLINETTGEQIILTGAIAPNNPIVIDHDKSLVYAENTQLGLMHLVALESDFFALKRGFNKITLAQNYSGQVSLEMFYRERYL